MKVRHKAEIIYMAAVLDGEGSLQIAVSRRDRRYYPIISVGQTNRSWLESFQRIWSGTIVNVFHKPSKWALSWLWVIWGDDMVYLLEAVRPYLRLKRAQADLLVELQRRINHNPRPIGKRLPREELEARRELYRQCRLLNRKGPRGNQLKLPEPSPQLPLFSG